MTKLKLMSKGLLGASVITLLTASNAFAGGTTAGTNVQNTFTLDYEVASVSQPQIDTTGTPTEFTVDRLVDLTVASAGNTIVAPGALNQELTFSVTNNGNDVQAYDFALVNETGDTFDTTGLNITYYADTGDNICDAADTAGTANAYTPGSGAASLDVAADATLCVVVDGDIGVSQTDTNTSEVSLIADTLESTTPAPGASAGDKVIADADSLNALTGNAENVLADGAGSTAADLANQADHSATGTYVVASADLTATKAVTIFAEDGAGCATIPGTPAAGNQYSIPGACVEYVITVENHGATATATDIAISDVLPDSLEFSASVRSASLVGGTYSQPAPGTDCDSGACTISLTGATLAAATVGTVTIRALVK